MFCKAIVILLLLSNQVLGEDDTTTELSSSVSTVETTTVSTTSPESTTTSTTSTESTTSHESTTTSPGSTPSTVSPALTASTTTNPNATTTSTAIPTTTVPFQPDCAAYQAWFNSTSGQNSTMKNGFYEVDDPLNSANPKLRVFCDFTTDGGYWTAIQVRSEDEVEFQFKDSTFGNYTEGFFTNTNVPSSYWIGLNRIAKLLENGETSLRIDMTTCGGLVYSAVYNNFRIKVDGNNYILESAEYVGGLSNAAGDSLISNGTKYDLTNKAFYTADSYNRTRDGPYNCAQLFGGGWWFNECGLSNLNGIHYPGCYYSALFANGIRWGSYWSGYYSPNRIEIKLRDPNKAPPTTPAASTVAATGTTPPPSTTTEATTTTTEAP